MKLSIIIVSYNVRDHLAACLRSIYGTCAGLDPEVIVVDNASADGSVQMVRDRFPQVSLIVNAENIGFARANNQGYAVSHGEYVLLLNPDTLIKPGAVQVVLRFMETVPDAGLAGCRLINTDGTVQKSIMNMPSTAEYLSRALFIDRLFFDRHKKATYYRGKPFTVGMVSGAFMMVRRGALRDGSLFKDNCFLYTEEPELCIRLWHNGWKVYFTPDGEIVHHGGQSTQGDEIRHFIELQRSMKQLFSRHWTGWGRIAISGSYWAHLATSTIASLIGVGSRSGRKRFYLFFRAAINYAFLRKTTPVTGHE